MAKGDKGDKSDGGSDYKFEVPDFDEDAFIHKEMVSFKTTTVLFGWGILAALVSWLIYSIMDGATMAWYLGLAVVALFGFLLRYVYPRLGINIEHFGRREWLGTGFLLFFTWLAFSLLFLNPPISDHSAPNVEMFANPPLQMSGGDVTFDIFFEDNHRVESTTFTLLHGAGSTVATMEDLTKVARGHYRYTLAGAEATIYTANATATDAKGHTASSEIAVSVKSRAVRLDASALEDHQLDSPAQTFLVTLGKAPVRVVYLDRNHDAILNEGDVVMEEDIALGGWKATSNFAGWQEGNNTFQVVVEIENRFHGLTRVDGANIILSSDNFWVDVTAPIGDYQAKITGENLLSPNEVRTPGPGLVVIGAVVLVGAAVRRR